MEVVLWDAVVLAQVALGMAPEVLDVVDVGWRWPPRSPVDD